MRTLLVVVGWCLLFVWCWPLAIVALLAWPLVWLLSLPLRLVSMSIEAVLALLKGLLLLPARVLGYRERPAGRPG